MYITSEDNDVKMIPIWTEVPLKDDFFPPLPAVISYFYDLLPCPTETSYIV